MDTWEIGLSPWIIDDGNYPNFRRGKIAKFALECGIKYLTPTSDTTTRSAVPLESSSEEKADIRHGIYRVEAEIAAATAYEEIIYGPIGPTPPPYDENGDPIITMQRMVRKAVPRMMYVLDFGICAYRSTPERFPVTKGQYVTAEIGIGIDPFFYFTRLHKIPEIPPLIYTWHIDRIRFVSGPLVEQRDERGRRVRVHDKERLTIEDVQGTHARGNPANWYLLDCTLLSNMPEVLDHDAMRAWYRQYQEVDWQ